MYLYFNEKGILKEIVNDEAIRLGNNDLNHIYIYWENAPEVDSMWVKFKLPSGETTNELSYSHIKVKKVIPYDKQRDLKYFKDYVSYDFFDISIPDGLNEEGEVVGLNVLAEDGLVSASVRFVLTLGQAISTLGLITFNVEKSVIQADLGINQSQFDYLLKHCLLNTTNSLLYYIKDLNQIDIEKAPLNSIFVYNAGTEEIPQIEFYYLSQSKELKKFVYKDLYIGSELEENKVLTKNQIDKAIALVSTNTLDYAINYTDDEILTLDNTLRDASGKIRSELLPSYVDDVVEYATFDDFPETGETGKIYLN